MVLKLCHTSSRYKFVAIYILYAVCFRKIYLDLRDPKRYRPDATCEVC